MEQSAYAADEFCYGLAEARCYVGNTAHGYQQADALLDFINKSHFIFHKMFWLSGQSRGICGLQILKHPTDAFNTIFVEQRKSSSTTIKGLYMGSMN